MDAAADAEGDLQDALCFRGGRKLLPYTAGTSDQ